MSKLEETIRSKDVAPEREPGPAGFQTESPAANETPKRKHPLVLTGLVILGLVGGGLYLNRWWHHTQAYVSTDDAQVTGNLVSCSSRVPGRIKALLVDEGQPLKAGQVIAKLDEAEAKAQLAQAEAALEVARTGLRATETGVKLQTAQSSSQVHQAEAAVRAAQASLAAARASADKAQADLRRAKKMAAAGAASRQALEASRASAIAADAGLQAAISQQRSAQEALSLAKASTQAVAIKQGSVDTVHAQIKQAEAAVATAQLQLAHTVITSPTTGVIARRSCNIGEQVVPGQAMFSIVQTDAVWISSYVEETQIHRIRPQAHVLVHLDAFRDQVFQGTVSRIGWVAGGQFSMFPSNNAQGNFTKIVQRLPVTIAVEDPRHQLRPGMSATIEIVAR